MENPRPLLINKRVKLPYGLKKKLREFITRVASCEKFNKKIRIIFVTNSYIKKLNRLFLGKKRATDVLSFDLGDEIEIYVSVDTARRKALEYGVPASYEIAKYVLHGLLHAAGYDHKKKSGIREMERKEEEYLRLWNSNY